MRRVLATVFLLWAVPAHAQFATVSLVYDPTNFSANSVSAAKSIITAAQMVQSVKNELLELLPLDAILAADGIINDMDELKRIMMEAEQVWYDVKSLQAQIDGLFGLETAPDTLEGLTARIWEMKQFYYRSLSYAMRTQTLMQTMFRTIDHVIGLVSSVSNFAGNKQAQQTLVQTNATISKTVAVLEVQTVAWQRVDTIERLTEKVTLQSLELINIKRLADHPRY